MNKGHGRVAILLRGWIGQRKSRLLKANGHCVNWQGANNITAQTCHHFWNASEDWQSLCHAPPAPAGKQKAETLKWAHCHLTRHDAINAHNPGQAKRQRAASCKGEKEDLTSHGWPHQIAGAALQ